MGHCWVHVREIYLKLGFKHVVMSVEVTGGFYFVNRFYFVGPLLSLMTKVGPSLSWYSDLKEGKFPCCLRTQNADGMGRGDDEMLFLG